MRLYHYTSRLGAQNIICLGQIEPGVGGYVYLSDARHRDGVTAANSPAITDKPVELGVEVDVDEALVEGPSPVQRYWEPGGRIYRTGGGDEFTCSVAVVVEDGRWFTLEAP